VKFVLEDRVAAHASNENESDKSFWGTQRELAWRSIGIENVGSTKQGLEAAQYRSLIGLLQQLMTCYSVPRHRVIGHSDILTDGQGALSNARIACPGFQFEWPQLENAKGQPIGLARTGGATGNDPVAGFFTAAAANKASGGKPVVLVENDYDPKPVGNKLRSGKFGRNEFPTVTDTPISLLQTWLSEIGYSVGKADGIYNHRFFRAVLHFQTHFLGQGATGNIDQQTAALIRAVRQANPKAD
jgi:N-acetyl-anhydromuramyl-L-alanine amidase AmpD